jgi:PEP-CTERM motif
MQKRSRFLALTTGVLIWGFGALETRAQQNIPLPSTLGQFVNADGSSNGNFTTVQQPNELDKFSGFSYSTDPVGSPPSAANIGLSAFLPPGSNESGLQFRGGFNAMPGMTVDYSIAYTVTAPPGSLITDAVLSAAMGNNGGTGSVSIVELLTFPNGSSSMEVSLPGSSSASLDFAGVSSILVQKDMFLNGGSLGANVTFVNQGFSSGAIPEPSSIVLLGLGMAFVVLTAYRRVSKRRAVVA